MSTVKKTLVDMFNLDELPPEKAGEMVDRLGKMVFQAVLVRALPMLSEEDFNEYEKISDTGEGDAILKFMSEKIPDFTKMIEEEAETLRTELSQEFKDAETN